MSWKKIFEYLARASQRVSHLRLYGSLNSCRDTVRLHRLIAGSVVHYQVDRHAPKHRWVFERDDDANCVVSMNAAVYDRLKRHGRLNQELLKNLEEYLGGHGEA